MNLNELREQIDIERDSLAHTLAELASLERDVADREPTVRGLAAAGLFLANIYTGIENVFSNSDAVVPDGRGACKLGKHPNLTISSACCVWFCHFQKKFRRTCLEGLLP